MAIRQVLADGDTVVITWDGHDVAVDGEPYDNTYASFLTFRGGGKIVEAIVYFDSTAFDDLRSRIVPIPEWRHVEVRGKRSLGDPTSSELHISGPCRTCEDRSGSAGSEDGTCLRSRDDARSIGAGGVTGSSD